MADMGQLRPLTRRRFLSGVVGIAGLGLLGNLSEASRRRGKGGRSRREPEQGPAPTGSGADAEGAGRAPALGTGAGGVDWVAIRQQFALDPELIHLAGMLLASHPAPVRDAIEAHRAELEREPAGYVLENDGRLRKRVVQAAGAYFGADPAGVALTDSTTMGLSLLYQGLQLAPDDEVLTTTHDHYSTWYNLELMSRRRGAKVRKVSLYDDPAEATADEMVAAIDEGIGPDTKVVAVTWVHSDTGVKIPLRAISEVVARHNTSRPQADRLLLCVDGVHGFGVENEDIDSLGCDFLVAGCHKWLHGPRGTGVVYAKDPKSWDEQVQLIPPFGIQSTAGLAHSPGGFHAFEHRWALDAAFEFHQGIGKENVHARIHELTAQLQEGLRAFPNAKVHTPASPSLSAGIVGFDFEGAKGREVVAALRREGIVLSLAPYGRGCIRATPGIVNDPEEIDATLRALHRYGRA